MNDIMNGREQGALYEMCIGEKYESDGFNVEYIGQMFGMNDHKIDLIAYNSNEIFLIQCKFRTNGKSAYTNAMPGFADSIKWFQETFHTKKKVTGTMITNTSFYPDGKEAAKKLGILLQTIPMPPCYSTSKKIPAPNTDFENFIRREIINHKQQKKKIILATCILLVALFICVITCIIITEKKQVYIAPFSGVRYHTNINCEGLENATTTKKISLAEALKEGYTLCGYCKQ